MTILCIPGNLLKQHLPSALANNTEGSYVLNNKKRVKDIIKVWVHLSKKGFSSIEARAKYLDFVKRYPLYGCRFYNASTSESSPKEVC